METMRFNFLLMVCLVVQESPIGNERFPFKPINKNGTLLDTHSPIQKLRETVNPFVSF